MIEKKLPDLLSLLESHARDATPEVVVVPRPPHRSLPLKLKLNMLTRNGRGTIRAVRVLLRRGRSKRRPLLNNLRPPK